MQNSAQKSWDQFWSGSAVLDAYSRDGQSHPLLDEAWLRFFADVKARQSGPLKAVDLASGRGVIVGYLQTTFAGGSLETSCVDSSPSAIAAIKERFGHVHGHVADVKKTGLASADYNIVTSQFGIEYAGAKAFLEAMRLVKAGGFLGLVIHYKEGQIYSDCQRSLEAVRQVLNSKVMENASKAFSAGFAHFASGQELNRYTKASAELGKSMKLVEKVLSTYGPGIANHTIVRLRDDIDAMASQLRGYDREETLLWLSQMRGELASFVGRMNAMCQAAAGKDMIAYITTNLLEQNFEIVRSSGIETSAGHLPIAWCLQARKLG
jgi:SAM-dependent methyltransferase